jgi:drug/metabolite transporter (DMT)-like permease
VSRSLKAHLLLIAITALWGTTFVLVKNALADIPPLLFNTARMTVAGMVLAVLFRRDLLRLRKGALLAGITVGIFLFLGYEFQTTGLNLTTPSKSAFITGLAMVLVPIFLCLFWRRTVRGWTVAGIGAAFFGLYLLTVPAGNGMLDLASINRGDILTLACAVSFAFQLIFVGQATERYCYRQIAAVQVITCMVLNWLTLPFAGNSSIRWSPAVIWTILVTAVGCTAIAFAIQAWAQQFTPPTHTALIFTLEPVFACFTSYLLMGERLGARSAVGAALILAGVLASELKGASTESEPSEEPAVDAASA